MIVAPSDEEFDRERPRVRPDAESWRYGNESVVWSPVALDPVALDPVAALLYQMFDGEVSIGELVADVSETIGLPVGVARDRIRSVVGQLDTGRLLTTSTSTPEVSDSYFPAPPNP